jgi:hypothetical protein
MKLAAERESEAPYWRCRPWLSNKRGTRAIYGGVALLTPHRRGAAMTVFLEPFASVYDDRSRLGVILARGRSGFEAYAADDHSLGLFPSPRKAAAAITTTRPWVKTSPNGVNNHRSGAGGD